MRKFAMILASHGMFAQEALRSAEMIIGSVQTNVGILSVTPGKDYATALAEMKSLYQQLDTTSGCLIFTDIYGGTPANTAAYIAIENISNIEVFSGLNLPMLLEILLDEQSDISQIKEKIIQLQPKTLVCITDQIKEKEKSDADQVDSY